VTPASDVVYHFRRDSLGLLATSELLVNINTDTAFTFDVLYSRLSQSNQIVYFRKHGP